MRLNLPLLVAACLSIYSANLPVLAQGHVAHLVETPSTCGDSTVRFISHGGLVASVTNGDDSAGGLWIDGIKGITPSSFTFETTGCENILIEGVGTTPGNGTFGFTVTANCNSPFDGFSVQTTRRGTNLITISVAGLFDISALPPGWKYSKLFIGFQSPGQGLVGNFLLGSDTQSHAIPNTHYSTANPFCVIQSSVVKETQQSSGNNYIFKYPNQ